jgi:hypothetical protein
MIVVITSYVASGTSHSTATRETWADDPMAATAR